MQLKETAVGVAVFLAATFLCVHEVSAEAAQYVSPGQSDYQMNNGTPPTYQYHHPAASSGSSTQQYPVGTLGVLTYPAPQQPAVQPYPSYSYPTPQPATQQYPSYPPSPLAPSQYTSYSYPTSQTATQQYPVQPTSTQYHYAAVQSDVSAATQLPSYTYDQQLDPRYQPVYHAAKPRESTAPKSWHPYMGLETRDGFDITAVFSYYEYKEPSLGVKETSSTPFLGLDISGTHGFGDGWFGTLEGRYAFVDVDYQGSGEIDDRSVVNWEWRGLFGKDILFEEFSLSPYVGFGYRTLFNDNRGVTSANAGGYRRYNELYYLPIGIHPRTHIDTDARLTSTLEFDAVLHGLQKSDLGDVGLGDPAIKNSQSSGFGLRGDITYETKNWAIGPYFIYWDMDQSKTKFAVDNSSTTCGNAGLPTPCTLVGDEPANSTLEAGLQVKYHFF